MFQMLLLVFTALASATGLDPRDAEAVAAAPKYVCYSHINANCPNHDITTLNTTLLYCQEECSLVQTCKSFQFRPDGLCVLKSYACAEGEITELGSGLRNLYTKIPCSKKCECEPSTCQNGGTCYLSGGTFACSCHTGWRGKTCDTKVTGCDTNPCMNGASCSPVVNTNDFTCACFKGWGGKTCKDRIDGCYHYENANCWGRNIGKSAITLKDCRSACNKKLDCKSFHHDGTTCWLRNFACKKSSLKDVGGYNKNEYIKVPCNGSCDPTPCRNNGACSVINGGDFACKCSGYWSGKNCEEVDASKVCYSYENANCRKHDLMNSDISLQDCKTACIKRKDCKSFHHNGVTCWLKNYVCKKNELNEVGFFNRNQYTKVPCNGPCDPTPCRNKGACSVSGKDFACACTGVWTGKTCEEVKAACYSYENANCWGHDLKWFNAPLQDCRRACDMVESCKSFHHNGKTCWLKKYACAGNEVREVGKANRNQFTKVPCNGPCDPTPCRNKATCSVSGNSYVCSCPGYWSGKTCNEVDATKVCYSYQNANCYGHDLAKLAISLEHCKIECIKRADCKSFHQNGNSCWLKKHVCTTNELREVGFSNRNQYTKVPCNGPCDPTPCRNAGVCSVSGASFTCKCTGVWTGKTCEEVIAGCYSYENANCVGHDLATFRASREDCQRGCDKRENCKSYHHNGNTCWLKDYACTKNEMTNIGWRNRNQYTKIPCVKTRAFDVNAADDELDEIPDDSSNGNVDLNSISNDGNANGHGGFGVKFSNRRWIV